MEHRHLPWWRFLLLMSGLSATQIFAHHSFSAHYDSEQRVEIEGTVTNFDFRSPHSLLYVEVGTDDELQEVWLVEFGSALSLRRQGWSGETFQPGDHVVVTGMPARTGAPRLNVVSLVRQGDGFVYEHGGALSSER